ncbi:MAG: MG2 domain-containing protein, partial [Thermoguttaceae bacterium]
MKRPAGRAPRGRAAGWIAGVTASVLILLSLGSYLYHRRQLDIIAAGHLRMVVTGPADLRAEAPAEYSVTTTSVTGEPLMCKVELSLHGADGKRLSGLKDNTDEQGHLSATMPADLALSGLVPSQARLKVVATRGAKREEAALPLGIRPARYATRVRLDRTEYRPGQTVRYGSVTLSQFGLAADRPLPVRFEIRGPDGRVVPGSPSEVLTDRGAGWGTFVLAEGLSSGRYTLVARSPDGSFPDENQSFLVARPEPRRFQKELRFLADRFAPGDTVRADFTARRADGKPAAGLPLRVVATIEGQTVYQSSAQADAAGQLRVEFLIPKKLQPRKGLLSVIVDDDAGSETVAEPIPLAAEGLDVQFKPEGGSLVPDVENRVYFAARGPDGRPVALRGTVYDSHDSAAAAVETSYEGLGWFTLQPQKQETYSLKIASPAGISEQPKLPAVSADARITLNTGSGVFAEGGPLEFRLRAAKAEVPLVVTAWCRGVQVGQQMLSSKAGKDRGDLNPVVIPLDESVGGVIRLGVYDFSKSPPERLAQRLVYRR